MRIRGVAYLLAVMLLFACVPCGAQTGINCDAGCGAIGSVTRHDLIAARVSPMAARGLGASTQAVTKVANSVAVEGSQSHTYNVPGFFLPRRAGDELQFGLYYNSPAWYR